MTFIKALLHPFHIFEKTKFGFGSRGCGIRPCRHDGNNIIRDSTSLPCHSYGKVSQFLFSKSAIYRRKTIIITKAKIQWIFFKRFQGKCLSIKCERKNFKLKLDFSFWFVCNLRQTFVIFFTFRALKMGLVVLIANYFNGVGAQTDMGNVRLRSSDRSHK